MSPGWRPVSPDQPGRQPDPSHTGHGVLAEDEAVPVVTAFGDGCPEKVWRRAASLAEDPEAIELMLRFHALREGERLGRCGQCNRPWPCVPWQVATLARILQPSAPSRRRKNPISWFRRPDSPG